VQWIAAVAGLEAGTRVLDAPCGFGRHSVEFARRDCDTTGVDFSDTELGRARKAAGEAGVSVELFGGLDGTPFSLDARRPVVVARK
jgi:cyclopropane fatty-acyl-phospholipid synthase-like methyltransferase